MAELMITELRKIAKDHLEKYIKCYDAIGKVVSTISARKDCNDTIVSDDADPRNLTESCAPVSGDKIILFSFDGEVPSVSDVLKLDFGFLMTTKPAWMTVRYTYKKHRYFDKLKLEHYVANMDNENNKLILQYDSVEEQVLMIEDRTMDISVGIDDYIVDGKVTSDDMADIIYTHATKLI